MKIKCKRDEILKAFHTINCINIQKDIYPVLENVRITAQNGQLVLKVTNLNISITYNLVSQDLEIMEPGELLLPALKLYNLIKETTDKEITIEKEELNGLLTTQSGNYCILGEDIHKFPEIPEFNIQDADIEISGENFKKLIKKTLFATTTEKTRYDLDNVLIEMFDENDETKIRFVATDGKRLAICDKTYKKINSVIARKFTVPAQALQQIDRVLNAVTPVKILLNFQENQLLLRTDEVLLSTRLSEAKFPPYERVIPKSLPFKAEFLQKDLTSVLKRVCLLADEKNKIVQLSFDKEAIKVFTRGEGTGEGNDQITAKYDGVPFNIKFNPNFLLDVLKIVDNNTIEYRLQDNKTAVLLIDGEDFQYVVLPIKVEEPEES